MREQLAELHGMNNAIYGGRQDGHSFQRGGKSAEKGTVEAHGGAPLATLPRLHQPANRVSSTGMSGAEAFMLICIAAVAATAIARSSGGGLIAGRGAGVVPQQQATGDAAPDRQAYNPVPGI